MFGAVPEGRVGEGPSNRVPSLRHYIKVNTAALRRPQAGELRPSIDELPLARNAPVILSGFPGIGASYSRGQQHHYASGISQETFGAFWIMCHAQTIPEQHANGAAFGDNPDKKVLNNQKLMF